LYCSVSGPALLEEHPAIERCLFRDRSVRRRHHFSYSQRTTVCGNTGANYARQISTCGLRWSNRACSWREHHCDNQRTCRGAVGLASWLGRPSRLGLAWRLGRPSRLGLASRLGRPSRLGLASRLGLGRLSRLGLCWLRSPRLGSRTLGLALGLAAVLLKAKPKRLARRSSPGGPGEAVAKYADLAPVVPTDPVPKRHDDLGYIRD
jgi:hypothetical protein